MDHLHQHEGMSNLNCLSYWYPKLVEAGLPVPRTEIVRMSVEAHQAIWGAMDGEPMGDRADPFLGELLAAVERIGLPCFLRTGQGSGKHSWDRCCNVRDVAKLPQHVYSLAEWSECVDLMGLPWDVWAVREFLPTMPLMVADRYGNMPVCREFRCFVNGAAVRCVHPYWPEDSLRQGMSELPADFAATYERMTNVSVSELADLRELASFAGAYIGGAWSVDILETSRGWFVTDMALAERSFHWEGCTA